MNRQRLIQIAVIIMLLAVLIAGCTIPDSAVSQSQPQTTTQTQPEKSSEKQSRGNGTVELVKSPVQDGIYSMKLAIPANYTSGDAARVAVPLDEFTLSDITSLSFWCYIDADTPVNPEGYWVPYFTFEIDTDGEPGCDTWVIGGVGTVQQSTDMWFEINLENDSLFHVASTVSNYESPFPINKMGILTEIKVAVGPDGKTALGDCPVSKIRLAIGNWGPGGPAGPVICYVDHLICNGEVLLK